MRDVNMPPVTMAFGSRTWRTVFRHGWYPNRRLAIVAFDQHTDEPLAKVTINVPQAEVAPGCVLIEDPADGTVTLALQLDALALVEPTGRGLQLGDERIAEFRLAGRWAYLDSHDPKEHR